MPLHRLASRAILSCVSVVLAGSFGLTAATAKVNKSLSVATPFEVGESPAGNYLAAVIAGADRDTVAAATFFREALRFDPRNKELIERAFVAALPTAACRKPSPWPTSCWSTSPITAWRGLRSGYAR